jgi:hypothetical protein
MGLKDRISKLETGQPAPGCQTCIKPNVVLYGEPTPPEHCPSCGGRWSSITCVSEECRKSTLALLSGERWTLRFDNPAHMGTKQALVDCGAVRLAGQAEPSTSTVREQVELPPPLHGQDIQETRPAPDDIIHKPEPEPDMKCNTPAPLPNVSAPHPQDERDDTALSWWEKQF